MNTPRKDFEAWAKNQGLPLATWADIPLEYRDLKTLEAWWSWKAAQAAMPAAEPTGWISVDERLPESWLDVMVWPHPTDYHITASIRQGKWTHSEQDSWGQQDYACTVTHWMPLPDAPIDAEIARTGSAA